LLYRPSRESFAHASHNLELHSHTHPKERHLESFEWRFCYKYKHSRTIYKNVRETKVNTCLLLRNATKATKILYLIKQQAKYIYKVKQLGEP